MMKKWETETIAEKKVMHGMIDVAGDYEAMDLAG